MNFETKIDHKIPTQYILNAVCKSIITNMVTIQNLEIIPNIFIHTGSVPIIKKYIQKNKIKQKQ
jgi:hypothetical protein